MTEEEKARARELRARGELYKPVPPQNRVELEPGDNTKYLQHAMDVMNLPPIDRANPRHVERRVKEYFSLCIGNDMKPTVNGLANALGVHRDTLLAWRHGEYRQGTHQEIAVRAHRVLEELWEDYMLNGKVNPVSGIFLAKNLFTGYADKQELVLTPKNGTLADEDVATIETKYKGLPED